MSADLLQTHERFIISACLIGIFSRYNGEQESILQLEELVRQGRAIPVCPEQLGGLSTPRSPCERLAERVVNKNGEDVTEQFHHGAQEALRIANLFGATGAILKQRSPTCGSGRIYDGTFTGTLTEGDGILTERLKASGISVYSEQDWEK